MARPEFTKKIVAEVINDIPPTALNAFSTVGDVNNNGMVDILICGRSGRMVWLENAGAAGRWTQHLIDEVEKMECGGCLSDITGSGYPDVINGGDWRSDEIYWWENPGGGDARWKKRLIAKTSYPKFHNVLFGDVTGDGRISLVTVNQGGKGGARIYRIPLPKDPTVSPWPDIEMVTSGKTEADPYQESRSVPEEGLAIGDVDGDGKNEIVCGTHWYKYVDGQWQEHRFAAGYIATKVAIGDIDGDGRNEIVLSEGDAKLFGRKEGCRLAWFKPGGDITALWNEHVLADNLIEAHSLQLGDVCGSGRQDIFVGELGIGNEQMDAYVERPPRLMIFENLGNDRFTEHVIDEGTGTHDAVLADMRNNGVPDIVGKPLIGSERWNVHVWYNNRGGSVE